MDNGPEKGADHPSQQENTDPEKKFRWSYEVSDYLIADLPGGKVFLVERKAWEQTLFVNGAQISLKK